MTTDFAQKIKSLENISTMLKQAFQPVPAAAPAGGMPPQGGDPAMMGGGGAPMDPAAMGGAPMDPAAAGGAPPPGGDGGQAMAQIESILSEVMSAVEQLAAKVEQVGQMAAQSDAKYQELVSAHTQMMSKLEMMDKAINASSPYEGAPEGPMGPGGAAPGMAPAPAPAAPMM